MKQIFIGGLNHNYIRRPAVIFRRLNWMDEQVSTALQRNKIDTPNRVGKVS
jgi:hypothetical protein